MLVAQILIKFKNSFKGTIVCGRNLGILAPCFQKASDPIQQLFLDKVRDYYSRSEGGRKLVDASPALQDELKSQLERVDTQYNAKKVNITAFPTFKFQEPVIDAAQKMEDDS